MTPSDAYLVVAELRRIANSLEEFLILAKGSDAAGKIQNPIPANSKHDLADKPQ